MSTVIVRLKYSRDTAWAALQPAFDHAIALAMEAEHQASKAQCVAMTGVDIPYPPLVLLLADSAPPLSSATKADWSVTP